jgi:hypothetical protein
VVGQRDSEAEVFEDPGVTEAIVLGVGNIADGPLGVCGRADKSGAEKYLGRGAVKAQLVV